MSNASAEINEFAETDFTKDSHLSKVIFAVSLLIVVFASLVGNILTCVVIYYDKTMHTATNCYLLNLAISDLLVTFPILMFAYQILYQATELVEIKDNVMTSNFSTCVQFLFIGILWNNGIFILTALSIERYIAICYPMLLQGASVCRRVGKIIFAIWIVAILGSIPTLLTLDFEDKDKNLTCEFRPTLIATVFTIMNTVVTFLLPLSIMIFMYTMIAFKVNDNQKYKLKNTSMINGGFKKTNVNKLIALTLSFVICWLPGYFIRMVMFLFDPTKIHWWFSLVYKIAMFNSSLSTVVNPLLFSLISFKFRKALKTLWNKNIKRRYFSSGKSETLTDTQHKSQHLVI